VTDNNELIRVSARTDIEDPTSIEPITDEYPANFEFPEIDIPEFIVVGPEPLTADPNKHAPDTEQIPFSISEPQTLEPAPKQSRPPTEVLSMQATAPLTDKP
jgi:hypothetical protein